MELTQHPLHSIGKSNEPAAAEGVSPAVYTDSDVKGQRFDSDKNGRPVAEPASIPRNLNLTGIQAPAMILDDELRVVWQNKQAVERIWHNAHAANNGNPTPLIFDLLFDTQFQHAVDNWRDWVSFFVHQAIDIVPRDSFLGRLDLMKSKHRAIVSALAERYLSEPHEAGSSKIGLRQTLNSGEIKRFSTVSIDFNEGRLFAFEPVPIHKSTGPLLRCHDIEQRFERIARQPNPIKEFYTVLGASLNQSTALRTALLSIEYCNLVNDLCNRCITVVERFGGVFGRHSDCGFSAYFLPADEYGDDNFSSVIKCAFDLRDLMMELNREWKVRKAWPQNIELNIGIHCENEYLGILNTALGDSLTSYGCALNIAADLSRLVQDGQIWVTKALINEMSRSERNQLRFGVCSSNGNREQLMVRNSFSKVQDLPGAFDLSAGTNSGIGSMVVTQLFDLQS